MRARFGTVRTRFCVLGLLGTLGITIFSGDSRAAEPIHLGESGLTITLPKGWEPADPKPGREKALGAFQSEDHTSSAFLTPASAPAQADMQQVMDGVIANFETAFVLRKVGEIKQGSLADSPAVFATLDAELRSKTGSDTLPFRFYLAVIDTGEGLYFFQGSVQAPVKREREQELMGLLRSLARIGS